jgi:opacity protein-like surface antigen
MSLCSVALVGEVHAQNVRLGLGTGATVPTGDYADADQAGWHVLGKLDFAIPRSPIDLRIDGFYGRSSHRSGVDGTATLTGGLADIVWHVPVGVPIVKPYLLAGGGVYRVESSIPSVSFSTSQTKFTLAGGVGVSFEAGPMRPFVEGRYVSVRASSGSTSFVPVTAGITVGAK